MQNLWTHKTSSRIRPLTLLLLSIMTVAASASSATQPAAVTSTDTDTQDVRAETATPVLHPFSASYKTEWKLGWFSIDIEASRTLRQLASGHWQLSFEAETSAAALKETSEFIFGNGRIMPQEYRYRASGLFNEPDRTLVFAPALHLVKDLENNRDYPKAWENEVQDNLTYMLQAGLDLAQGKQELNYEVFEKKRSKTFSFRVIGEEELNTGIGHLQTIKVQQLRKKSNREIFAWFAIDHHYQLVRLVDKENGKTRYQIDITGLKD